MKIISSCNKCLIGAVLVLCNLVLLVFNTPTLPKKALLTSQSILIGPEELVVIFNNELQEFKGKNKFIASQITNSLNDESDKFMLKYKKISKSSFLEVPLLEKNTINEFIESHFKG